MIKRLSWLISLVAIGVVLVATPADARRGGGHGWHGGGWHGGGWRGGWGGGVGWGFGPAWGGYYSPYYYGPSYYRPYPYYAYPRYACGSRWIKVRRSGQLVWKRVRIRCY